MVPFQYHQKFFKNLKKEKTDKFGLNDNIKNELELILKNIILPK